MTSADKGVKTPIGMIARTTVEARAVIETKIEMDAIAYRREED